MAKRLTPALEATARNAQTAAARWRGHRQLCHTCHQAAQDSCPQNACGEGFRLRQAVTRASHAEARRRAPRAGEEQLSLGGM